MENRIENKLLTLAIETSSAQGSVALFQPDKLASELIISTGLTHGKQLIPTIKEILEENSVALTDVRLVAVDVGPGSYTGVRIGVAAAKTLAHFSGIPLVDVISLDALAAGLEVTGNCIAAIDARRGKLYAALYEKGKGQLKRVSDHSLLTPQELIKLAPEGAHIAGDGTLRYDELFTDAGLTVAPLDAATPSALKVAELGCTLYASGRTADPLALIPVYMRPSEAEEKFGISVFKY